MARKISLLLAVVGLLLPAVPGRAQVPSSQDQEDPNPQARPAPYVLPPVGQVPAVPAIVNPILDDSPVAGPGWFANLDLMILRPHLVSNLTGSPNQGVDTLNLTTLGPMGTFVSPSLELGYRLAEQLGEFHVGYRYEGGQTSGPSADTPGAMQTDRLDMSVIDFDWATHNPFTLGPGWDLRFNVGVRVATIYFDTRRSFAAGGPVADELATSFFVGVGPEAGAELTRELFVPGLNVYGRVSGASLFGDIHGTFAQATMAGAANDSFRDQVSVPVLALQAGLSYAPPRWNYSRVLVGYVWEEFWDIGRLNNSTGDLLNRGIICRIEWNF